VVLPWRLTVSKSPIWLSGEAWAVIAPHLPQNQPGARPVDDRRVVSGIVHMLRSGGRWRDFPARERSLHHHHQSLEPMEWPSRLGPHPRCADRRRPHR
jgi:transposase